jgi:hypothetical protein
VVAIAEACGAPESLLTVFALLATADGAFDVVLDAFVDKTTSGAVTGGCVGAAVDVPVAFFATTTGLVLGFEVVLADLAVETECGELAFAPTVAFALAVVFTLTKVFALAPVIALSICAAEGIGAAGLLAIGVTLAATVATGSGGVAAELDVAAAAGTTLRDGSGWFEELLATSLSLGSSSGGRLGIAESGT